jgi:parallel beta-helix repeat protein
VRRRLWASRPWGAGWHGRPARGFGRVGDLGNVATGDGSQTGIKARRPTRGRLAVVALFALAAGIAVAAPAALNPAPKAIIDAANYPNLQAAFDAVPEGGGLIRLPPGNFEIREPLRLGRGDVRVEGAGAATHIINRNETGEPALLIRPASYPADRRARIWRVQIGNFRISGNPKSGDGIRLEAVQELFIHHMSIDRNGGHGIHTIQCTENPRIIGCNITYNRLAGLNLIGAHDIVVSGNQFEENQDAVRCIDGFNLNLSGNNIDDHLRYGVVIENTHSSVLSGNMIEQCEGTAIILDRDCFGITVSANVLASNTQGGIDLRDAWGCSITGNTFVRIYDYSVQVGRNSGRIVISGNTFTNTHMGEGKVRFPITHQNPNYLDDGTGIILDGTSDILVSGNLFSGLSKPAVVATGDAHRIMVHGNIVTDMYPRSSDRRPVIDLGTARDSSVKDNMLPAGPARATGR